MFINFIYNHVYHIPHALFNFSVHWVLHVCIFDYYIYFLNIFFQFIYNLGSHFVCSGCQIRLTGKERCF